MARVLVELLPFLGGGGGATAECEARDPFGVELAEPERERRVDVAALRLDRGLVELDRLINTAERRGIAGGGGEQARVGREFRDAGEADGEGARGIGVVLVGANLLGEVAVG